MTKIFSILVILIEKQQENVASSSSMPCANNAGDWSETGDSSNGNGKKRKGNFGNMKNRFKKFKNAPTKKNNPSRYGLFLKVFEILIKFIIYRVEYYLLLKTNLLLFTII